MEKESYVHRTGRTGRAGNKGKFISAIEKYIGFEIPKMEAPKKDEVVRGKAAFEDKISGRRVVHNNKTPRINKDIMKLHLSGGKNAEHDFPLFFKGLLFVEDEKQMRSVIY